MFSGISLKQLIAELNRAIAAKLYMNTNSDTLPQKPIAVAIAEDLKLWNILLRSYVLTRMDCPA